MSGATLALALQWASVLGSLLTAAKLYFTGLSKRYSIFFLYFLFRVAGGLATLVMDVKSDAYFYFWMFSSPVIWIFYVWVILELCRLVLERHRGLYTLGTYAMWLGMAISVALSIISMAVKFKSAPSQRAISWDRSIVYSMLAVDRGITFCLAIFLLLMLLFISRYPVRLSRNIVLHTTLYTLYFLSNTLSIILVRVFGLKTYTTFDTALVAVADLCIFAWLIFLTPKGEEVRVNVARFSPENEERLLMHLDSFNSTLLQTAKNRP